MSSNSYSNGVHGNLFEVGKYYYATAIGPLEFANCLPRNLTLAWLSDQVSAASGSLVLVPTILLLPILLLLLLRPTHNNNSIFA